MLDEQRSTDEMVATTSLTDQSRTVVQQLYDAAVKGDVEAVLGCLAEDLVVYEPAFLPYGGTYEGHDSFLGLFGGISSYYDMSRVAVDHLVADGDKVFAVLRIPDLKTGENVVIAEESVVRDGQVVEMRIFFHDVQSLLEQSD